MNTIWKRLTSESPSFFKKIQIIMGSLAGIGAALISIPTMVPAIAWPPMITTIGGYCIAIGIVSGAIAKATVADPKVLQDNNSQNTNEQKKP